MSDIDYIEKFVVSAFETANGCSACFLSVQKFVMCTFRDYKYL